MTAKIYFRVTSQGPAGPTTRTLGYHHKDTGPRHRTRKRGNAHKPGPTRRTYIDIYLPWVRYPLAASSIRHRGTPNQARTDEPAIITWRVPSVQPSGFPWAAASPRRIERDSNRSPRCSRRARVACRVRRSTMNDDAVKMPSELVLKDPPAPSSASDDAQMTPHCGMIDRGGEMGAVTKGNETGTTNSKSPSSISGNWHCAWCSRRFRARSSGGSKQRYCNPTCRHALDRAARRLVRKALAVGALSIEELRRV